MTGARGGRRAFRAQGRLAIALAVALAGLLAGPVAAAADEGSEESGYGYALAHELMSPYCPGRTLAACPSEQAAELRQWILLQEAAGATREEVVATLEARFGEVIRSSPEAEGWGLAAWLLPGAAVAAGALMVWLVLRRMVRPAASSAARDGVPDAPASPPSSRESAPDEGELERLVDAELAASDR